MTKAQVIAWSTNCAWCFTDTDGPEYCGRCENLRCEYCGRVGVQGDRETCSECITTLAMRQQASHETNTEVLQEQEARRS